MNSDSTGSKTDRILSFVFPLTFSLYPVLNLLAANFQEIGTSETFRSFAAVLIFTTAIMLMLSWLLKDQAKASLLTVLMLLFFFSYGHIYQQIEGTTLWSLNIGRHRYLLPVFMITFLLVVLPVTRGKTISTTGIRFISIGALALVILPVANIGYQFVNSQSTWEGGPVDQAIDTMIERVPEPAPKPDIYYIILDGYARADHLETILDYSNQSFIADLEALGFYIAEQSNTNFNWTALSLASSLNMDFIQELDIDLVYGNYPAVFVDPIRHSRARAILEELGYSTVAFRTNYLPTEIIDAEYYLTTDEGELDDLQSQFAFNGFETLLIRSSAALLVWDLAGPQARNWVGLRIDYPRLVMRDTILFQFDQLEGVSEIESPKFVFAHIVAPHSPYLFGPDGEYVSADGSFSLADTDSLVHGNRGSLYVNQLRYVNKRVIAALTEIISGSESPPIVIIQSDHGPCIHVMSCAEGPGLDMKFGILNAYLVPEECKEHFYAEISPANSFRTIFNCVFDAGLPLLEDRSFYTNHPRYSAYEFIDVTDEVE